MVHIITDSTSDLTAEELKELNVQMIHMRVIFEDGVYTDGIDITKDQFYAKQAEAKTLPKTTQVNPRNTAIFSSPCWIPVTRWWPSVIPWA